MEPQLSKFGHIHCYFQAPDGNEQRVGFTPTGFNYPSTCVTYSRVLAKKNERKSILQLCTKLSTTTEI